MARPKTITKQLSPNDTGETGAHQAGILVPKGTEILSFFPDLGCSEKNPRVKMYFEDETGKTWKFNFIYYNNKFFDEKGTRNEYRLTGMTAYYRENGLVAGDAIILTRGDDDTYYIRYKRENKINIQRSTSADGETTTRLVIGGGWKVVDY